MGVGGISIIFFPHWGGTYAFYFGLGEEHATLNRLGVFFFSTCVLLLYSEDPHMPGGHVLPNIWNLEICLPQIFRIDTTNVAKAGCVRTVMRVMCRFIQFCWLCVVGGVAVFCWSALTACVMMQFVRSICILLKKLAFCFGDHSQSLRAVCCCITTYIYFFLKNIKVKGWSCIFPQWVREAQGK